MSDVIHSSLKVKVRTHEKANTRCDMCYGLCPAVPTDHDVRQYMSMSVVRDAGDTVQMQYHDILTPHGSFAPVPPCLFLIMDL
jgi:hypothetical protein